MRSGFANADQVATRSRAHPPRADLARSRHPEARKVAEFYATTFPDSVVGRAISTPDNFPGGRKGAKLTVEFTVLGGRFVDLNGGPSFKAHESMRRMVVAEH